MHPIAPSPWLEVSRGRWRDRVRPKSYWTYRHGKTSFCIDMCLDEWYLEERWIMVGGGLKAQGRACRSRFKRLRRAINFERNSGIGSSHERNVACCSYANKSLLSSVEDESTLWHDKLNKAYEPALVMEATRWLRNAWLASLNATSIFESPTWSLQSRICLY